MPNSLLTKRILADALKTLMQKTPFAKISIGDITGACGMNRNSFYYHFQDKYELVNWIFLTEVTEGFGQQEVLDASGWLLLEHLCRYFYDNRAFYANAMSYEGPDSFNSYLQELMHTLFEMRADDMFTGDADPEYRAFFFAFFIDAFTMALNRWIRSDEPCPPERFAHMLRRALTGSAERLLEEQG